MATADWFKRLVVPIADKIVYSSNAYVSMKSELNSMSRTLVDFARTPAGPADERLVEAAALVRPMEWEGLHLIRVGGDDDGGYLMADDFAVAGAISVGVGPDVSWDQSVAARGVRVAMFDPTVRTLPAAVPGGVFHRIGIGPGGGSSEYQPLPSLVQLAGFADTDQLILKVDVEGAEWASFTGLTAADLAQYRQMAFEFHGLRALRDEDSATAVLDVLRLLARSHVPVHVHANNYDDLVRFDDLWFPNAIEVSYVRRDLAGPLRPTARIGDAGDRPCDPRTADISLEGLAQL